MSATGPGPAGRPGIPSLSGATGPAPLHMIVIGDGSWYAFRLDGREFYARAESDRTTGHMVLTEIPEPYICLDCGKSYFGGPHEWAYDDEVERHDYRPRGDFQRGSE